ncbi:hypothetical protein RHGRI_007266 [Rhododendron griersonianum]|uniref:Uncharacterized protein n=1 Tax=Rhododendron griersonianum TaxID=479676 RepID=A0AAV6KZA5_9ERIC|nr:hypothetical protein RHGRI_007266 [Rhododendron griersonianum]
MEETLKIPRTIVVRRWPEVDLRWSAWVEDGWRVVGREFNNFEFDDVRKLAAELSGQIHPQGTSGFGWQSCSAWEPGLAYLDSAQHSKE